LQARGGRDKLERMTRPWLLALALLPAALSAQPIYTWVGPRGTVHYADRPHPGARRVELGAAQSFDLRALPAPSAPAGVLPRRPQAPSPARPSLRILSPANGASLFNIGGVTAATVGVRGLLPGEELVYTLDGKRVAGPTTSSSVTLDHVWRGTHRLTVRLLAPTGRILARAESVFYVHQHSILLHPHPPLLATLGTRASMRP
jgi:hypothetical protein